MKFNRHAIRRNPYLSCHLVRCTKFGRVNQEFLPHLQEMKCELSVCLLNSNIILMPLVDRRRKRRTERFPIPIIRNKRRVLRKISPNWQRVEADQTWRRTRQRTETEKCRIRVKCGILRPDQNIDCRYRSLHYRLGQWTVVCCRRGPTDCVGSLRIRRC